jgi:hypothetical protein
VEEVAKAVTAFEIQRVYGAGIWKIFVFQENITAILRERVHPLGYLKVS